MDYKIYTKYETNTTEQNEKIIDPEDKEITIKSLENFRYTMQENSSWDATDQHSNYNHISHNTLL